MWKMLWSGLIIVLLVGFVWSTVDSRSSVKNPAISKMANYGRFQSNERVQDDISGEGSAASLLSEPSDSDLVERYEMVRETNYFGFRNANASSCPVTGSSCGSEIANRATSNESICEKSSSEPSLIAEDENSVDKELEDELTFETKRSSDNLCATKYENVGKTLRSLIKSISEPAELQNKEDTSRDEGDGRSAVLSKLRCFINLERCTYNLVWKIARSFGMRKSNRFWDVMWFDVDAGIKSKQIFIDKCSKMNHFQLISHFPGFWSLSSKDLLVRNLQRMQKHFPRHYAVFPKSWILPRDGLQLAIYVRNHKKVFLIAKPADGCAGNGIFVTQDVVLSGRKIVYQLYVRPFLMDGYKFDFRVYVLMTSCDPLRLYVYNEGLARFATVKYEEPTRENCRDVFMHLTNSCVNTRNPSFVKDETVGHSRRMSRIFEWFRNHRIDPEKIRNSMDDAIIKTIIAVLPTLRHNYKIHFPLDTHSDRCFEIMGFDVMLDRNLNVHVLEVNPSPSFGSVTHTSFETELKESVLHDTFKILEGNVSCKLKKRSRTTSQRAKRRQREIDELSCLVDWENSHLGNFRKVYPPRPSLEKYYQKFINKDISLQYNLT